jgi:hypothetical protein
MQVVVRLLDSGSNIKVYVDDHMLIDTYVNDDEQGDRGDSHFVLGSV